MRARSQGSGDRFAMRLRSIGVPFVPTAEAKTSRIWRSQPRHAGKRLLSIRIPGNRLRNGQPTASVD
ncbi:hypothetical protein CJO79_22030 (plasmid) [Ralstonia solanacearum]|nr:hypothetical protein CJO76_22050 [Ralstonia solanacearum]AXV93618.1 hypothetical protein CJO79_22030 [Ralstonia solanacearum]AXW22070.1 hypothetical protein CJO85_22130 [Ralstonia solanacearum]AXW78508.1 hypothetical protein CJO97_22030 [Ralstonia solanacearum]